MSLALPRLQTRHATSSRSKFNASSKIPNQTHSLNFAGEGGCWLHPYYVASSSHAGDATIWSASRSACRQRHCGVNGNRRHSSTGSSLLVLHALLLIFPVPLLAYAVSPSCMFRHWFLRSFSTSHHQKSCDRGVRVTWQTFFCYIVSVR